MTAEFQIDVCQVDVDVEFRDDDWHVLMMDRGAPKVRAGEVVHEADAIIPKVTGMEL